MTHWPGGVFTVAVKQTYLWLTSHEAHINNSSSGENNYLSVTHTYTDQLENRARPGRAGLGRAKGGKRNHPKFKINICDGNDRGGVRSTPEQLSGSLAGIFYFDEQR